MTSSIRVVVVDDHSLFRTGLIEILRSIDDFDVEAEGASADDAISLALELKPDVIILDVSMPGPDATFTIRTIRDNCPATQIVVVTMFDDPRLVHELIKTGAAAYLLKSCDRGELAAAVRLAARSDNTILVSVSRSAFVGLTRTAPTSHDGLSDREASVLRLMAQAKNNHDIGVMLNISDATVKRHVSNIYAKLSVTSRVEALLAAREAGLVPN